MQIDNNDDVIVERVRNGDKQAFNLLVAKYQYKIKNLVSRFVRDSAEQEDITQEVFIKAYQAVGQFRGDSAFYTWLYRIAVNTAKNHLLANTRRPLNQDVDVDDVRQARNISELTNNISPEAVMQTDQLVELIKTALGKLPEELKQALVLREFDGLSYDDIALAMECPVGTVRSRIFRAREGIEQYIEKMS